MTAVIQPYITQRIMAAMMCIIVRATIGMRTPLSPEKLLEHISECAVPYISPGECLLPIREGYWQTVRMYSTGDSYIKSCTASGWGLRRDAR